MSAPATTVVIPTRDRHAPLAACLEALAAVRPPPGGFEVVVVDDGGGGPAWLAALVEAIGGADDVAAGGITHAGLPGNPWARASAAVEAAVYAHENRDPGRARFLTPKNLVVP